MTWFFAAVQQRDAFECGCNCGDVRSCSAMSLTTTRQPAMSCICDKRIDDELFHDRRGGFRRPATYSQPGDLLNGLDNAVICRAEGAAVFVEQAELSFTVVVDAQPFSEPIHFRVAEVFFHACRFYPPRWRPPNLIGVPATGAPTKAARLPRDPLLVRYAA